MKRLRLQLLLATLGVLVLGVFVLNGMTLAMSHEKGPNAEDLWKHLQEADYTENWKPYGNAPEGFYEGTRPHGALLRTFGNETAVSHTDELPPGSIIVKENYKPNKELAAITVMKKVEEYDPENQNWFWVKYNPDGSVAEAKGKKLSGKVGSCIGCHGSAGGDDYVYTNDEEEG